MAYVLGYDGVLNYNTAGAGGGGSWVELTNTRNVTVSLERGLADVTVRANNGWRAQVGALKDLSLEFEMVYDNADTGMGVIRDAFLDGDVVGFQVYDADDEGPVFDGVVTNFSINQDLEEAFIVSVTVVPTYSATAPTWTGGA